MVFTDFEIIFGDQINVITSSDYSSIPQLNHICISSRQTNRKYIFITRLGRTNLVLVNNKS